VKHYVSPSPDSDQPAIGSWPQRDVEFGKDGLEHIDTMQVASGIKGTTELRVLDGVLRENEDHVFGKYKGISKWELPGDLEADFLKEGWLDEVRTGKGLIRDLVQARVSDWKVDQVTGFAEINGERRHVRRVIASTPKKTVNVRVVYDYMGALD
jgi:hypothetical protein